MVGKYVIVRSVNAGVFAGTVENKQGDEMVLTGARRLWYWKGAASLSQLAMEGVSCPNECKFPPEVDRVTVLGVCEVLDTTQAARDSIAGVKPWRA